MVQDRRVFFRHFVYSILYVYDMAHCLFAFNDSKIKLKLITPDIKVKNVKSIVCCAVQSIFKNISLCVRYSSQSF